MLTRFLSQVNNFFWTTLMEIYSFSHYFFHSFCVALVIDYQSSTFPPFLYCFFFFQIDDGRELKFWVADTLMIPSLSQSSQQLFLGHPQGNLFLFPLLFSQLLRGTSYWLPVPHFSSLPLLLFFFFLNRWWRTGKFRGNRLSAITTKLRNTKGPFGLN